MVKTIWYVFFHVRLEMVTRKICISDLSVQGNAYKIRILPHWLPPILQLRDKIESFFTQSNSFHLSPRISFGPPEARPSDVQNQQFKNRVAITPFNGRIDSSSGKLRSRQKFEERIKRLPNNISQFLSI